MRYPDYIEQDFEFPEFYRVRMNYPDDRLENLDAEIVRGMEEVLPTSGISAGDTVAVAVGSRGINNLAQMVKVVCRKLLSIGADPFVIPAMGSHGGATPEGQRAILEQLGVTEDLVGVPIRSSMDVVQIATLYGEVPVYFSSDAFEADHSICLNRIKLHTKFKAPVESGLCKMLCLGMGKHAGALTWHNWALKYGFYPLLKDMAAEVVRLSNVRFGIGIVEDANDHTAYVEAIPAAEIVTREPALLEKAKAYFPKLPVRNLDVLVIQQIGKEISGAGMDPNVTGRASDLMEDDFSESLKATRIAVLNMSEQTEGNGLGIGLADFITEKVFEQLDYEKVLMNALTSVSVRKAFIPVRMPNECKAIQACFTTLGPVSAQDVRAIIIRDTLHVFEFWASPALLDELKILPTVEILEKSRLEFDAEGVLQLAD
ncbi:MAG: hypothetical protein KAT93_04020 [Desulfuromonadales bacterium]|nr:hypothetical protein [Desulfuromonadales bacterium]